MNLSDKELTNGEVLFIIALFTFLLCVVAVLSENSGQRSGMEKGYKLAMENKVKVTYTTNIVEKIEFKE